KVNACGWSNGLKANHIRRDHVPLDSKWPTDRCRSERANAPVHISCCHTTGAVHADEVTFDDRVATQLGDLDTIIAIVGNYVPGTNVAAANCRGGAHTIDVNAVLEIANARPTGSSGSYPDQIPLNQVVGCRRGAVDQDSVIGVARE